MKRIFTTRAMSSLLIVVLATSVIFSGCQKTEETSSTSSAEETVLTETSTETVQETEGYYPLELTDFYGQTVTIENEPKTVVSASPVITEIIYELGQENRLIGRTDYCDYPEEVSSIPSIGAIDNPNVETLVEMNPDIVIASSVLSEDSYNKLTELGLTVVIVRDETSFEGMFTNINTVAEILNCVDKAEVLTNELNERLDAINPISEEISVYYCVGFGEYGEYAATGDTYISEMIEFTGASNAAKDAQYWSFSLEALIEADPDYILLPEWAYDDFISTEPYSELSAVKNNKVLVINPNEFERQTARNVDAIEMLYEIISQ